MDTQYKFRWILRDDDGVIEKALIAFYEGVYLPNQPVKHPISGKTMGFSNQFRAFTKLKRSQLKHLKAKEFAQGKDNVEADAVYNQADFGLISTDDELRTFLNGELAKDTGRNPIPEQMIN